MKKTAQLTKNAPLLIFVISLISFVLSQLIINSILAPLGIQLQSLNREKNFLVEENRTMEEQIAKANSITVVHKLADKALSLSTASKTTIYLEKDSLVANR